MNGQLTDSRQSFLPGIVVLISFLSISCSDTSGPPLVTYSCDDEKKKKQSPNFPRSFLFSPDYSPIPLRSVDFS